MKYFVLSALTGTLLIGSAEAVLVIDNFGTSIGGSAAASGPTAAFFGGLSPFPDREAAFNFTTGGSNAYLNELQIILAVGDASSPMVATLSTGASVPGGTNPVALGTFAPVSALPTIQTATFTQTPSTILLTANTEYWVHLTVPTGAGIYTMSFSDTPTYSNGYALDEAWGYTPASGIPPTGWNLDGTSGVARIRLDVTPVPEPTAALLCGLGAIVLLHGRR
jgi:hypothetical protein